MKKSVKKPAKTRWQTHVYLDADDRAALEALAKRESRSVTAQITVFVRLGLAAANN
jgi:hypothetical protein